jgi:hypothetical protein
MIGLGFDESAKAARIAAHCREHAIERVFVLTGERAPAPAVPEGVPCDVVTWTGIIKYVNYYRLLQEINRSCLVVVNECLRRQFRGELTYNCIRMYLNQTPHALIFQHLPIIDTWDDFAVLFDFETRSRWKRDKVTPELLREAIIEDVSPTITLSAQHVSVSAKTHAEYAKQRAELFAEARADVDKDPHNIPRALALVPGKDKARATDPAKRYVARNQRLKLPHVETYRDITGDGGARTVLELPHNFVDFADFLSVTRQSEVEIMVADTKADAWYWQRYVAWTERLHDAQASLRSR